MTQKKVLVVASAGGHWVQLMRMTPAFEHHQIYWLSTIEGLSKQIPFGLFFKVRDASMWDKPGLLIMAIQIAWLMIRIRPKVVLTTGAAPGYFAVIFGRILGAKTIWIDSIANSEELSLAGKWAGRWAHHWLTQWPELSQKHGPDFIGSVL